MNYVIRFANGEEWWTRATYLAWVLETALAKSATVTVERKAA